MPDITLINPPLSDDPGNHPVPYGLWQLASFITAKGMSADILDLNFIWRSFNSSYDELNAYVQDVGSPIVGFTCMGSNLATALEFAEDLKRGRPDVIIIFGGPHVSLISKEFISTFSFVDYVVVGEGEETLLEFIKAYRIGINCENVTGVVGKSGRFRPRTLMNNLDNLPYLNMDLLNWREYISNHSSFAFPILAGSGCPFQCSFCSTSVMWERKFRVKSTKRLIDEMKFISKFTGVRSFDLIHDIFTANKNYLKSFCEDILGSGIRWMCSSRIDGKIEECFSMMALAGCSGIFFGVESGSKRIQDEIGKRIKVSKITETMQSCMNVGIDFVCSTVFGFPTENWEDIQKTVELCLKARAMGAWRSNLHMLLSYPGTSIYREYERGLILETRDFKRGGLPLIMDRSMVWITKYPNLFSHFYWINHPFISKDEMYVLHSWDALLASHPETLQKFLEECHELRIAIGQFSKHFSSEISLLDTLKEAVEELGSMSCKLSFEEESFILKILDIYNSENIANGHVKKIYTRRDALGKDVNYKIKDNGEVDVIF